MLDPNVNFIVVVSFVIILGIVLATVVFITENLQKRPVSRQKHA